MKISGKDLFFLFKLCMISLGAFVERITEEIIWDY